MWQAPDGVSFKMRLYDDQRHSVVLGLGTDRVIAADMERMALSFRAQRKWPWVRLLVSKAVKIGNAYDAYTAGSVDTFFADLLSVRNDPDLDPLVTLWEEQGAEPKYVRQVRRMIPAGTRHPLSAFRRRAIAQWLKTVKPEARTKQLSRATRERYKAALSSFAEWLIEHEYIEGNPVHGIKLEEARALKEAKRAKGLAFLEETDARALVEKLEEPYRSLEALMTSSGAEWQAIERAAREDFDLEHRLFHAHGSKTSYRDRWVEVTEDWAWELVAARVRQRAAEAPDAPIWPVDEKDALEAHHAAAKALKLKRTTLHNHRHTFAVLWIRRGATGGLRSDRRDTQWLKNQLGHAPQSMQLFTTYGVYINAVKLTAQQQARQTSGKAKVTPSVTSPSISHEVDHAKS